MDATRTLVQSKLPEGVELRDLGELRLKDLREPERLHQLVILGLPADFPAEGENLDDDALAGLRG